MSHPDYGHHPHGHMHDPHCGGMPGWHDYPSGHNAWCYPRPEHHDAGHGKVLLPREIMVDAATPAIETFIGGGAPASLRLEYMPLSGAPSPSISVKLVSGSGTQTWEEPAPGPDFAAKSDFSACAPGTRVLLQVNGMVARMRWFEAVEY